MHTTAEIRYSITQHFLEGEHGPIRYWASEPRQGLPVLLIHGYGALIEHWRAVMRPIARDHTCYALDLYNFGYSARPQAPPGKQLWANQVATLIRQVIGEPAVVVGHSMGGIAAIQTAHDYPDLVKGLVLVDSSGLFDPDRPPTDFDRLLVGLTGTPLLGEMLAGVFGNEFGVRQMLYSTYHNKEKVTPDLIRTFCGPLRRYSAASYLAVTRSFERLLITVKPGEVAAPTLIIWGAEDRSIPPTIAPLFKALMLPQAEIRVIAESGHCPFDETPDAFCEVLLPWLGRL